MVTTGSSGGFLLAFLAAFEVGDRVAMARPGYPCYRNVLTALGCEVVEIPTGPETRFQPTVEQVAALDDIQRPGPGLARPTRPAPCCFPSELAALARWCEDNAVQLISDEIYHGIEYAPLDGHPALARSRLGDLAARPSCSARFSKYFSMTGWRIGWMLVPDRLRRAVDVLTGNFTICPPVIAQRACLAAFDRGVVRRARRPRRPLRRQPRPAARRAARARPRPVWPRPTAPSTCTPTSGTSPTTR